MTDTFIDYGKPGPIPGWVYAVPMRERACFFGKHTWESIRATRPRVIEQIVVLDRVSRGRQNFDSKPTVYVIRNLINDKLYVGVSTAVLKRYLAHLSEATSGSDRLLAKAIRKYGPESFCLYVWGVFYSYERALYGERELIASILPEYNMTAGGQGNVGGCGPWKGKKMPEALIAKRTATRRLRLRWAWTRQ